MSPDHISAASPQGTPKMNNPIDAMRFIAIASAVSMIIIAVNAGQTDIRGN